MQVLWKKSTEYYDVWEGQYKRETIKWTKLSETSEERRE